MRHYAKFCDGIWCAAFLYEQVAHEGVQGQIGGCVLERIVGFVHRGAQTSQTRQLIDAVHGVEHSAGLYLQDHICKRGGHLAFLFRHLFACFMKLFAPIGAHEQSIDVVAYFFQDSFIGLILVRFDQWFVLLAHFVGFIG